MSCPHDDRPQDDDIEVVPIPLDRATIRRLSALARVYGVYPVDLAGSLLRDIVADDAMAHAGIPDHTLN